MEVESSNEISRILLSDVDSVKDTETRPIARLFKRLIANDKEQNTMLTNAQLIEILQTEFKMDISTLHELEVEIYLSVIKKFLIDWPQWDEFDREITKLKNSKDFDKIEKVLEQKYVTFKEYLKTRVEIAKNKAQKLVKNLEDSHGSSSQEVPDKEKSKNTVVMEVYCNRHQLQGLIMRTPLTERNNTIFNASSGIPRTINYTSYDLNTILRYWDININIVSRDISFTYQMKANSQHTLVNKKHSNCAYEKTILNDDLQKRIEKKTKKAVLVDDIYNLLTHIPVPNDQNHLLYFFQVLANIFIMDFGSYDSIEVPGRYRKYICKYPYVRYLYVASGVENSKYDLQIEEVLSPAVSYTFSHFEKCTSKPQSPTLDQILVVNVECSLCKTTIKDVSVENILEHYKEFHYGEKELMCTNCFYKLDVVEIGQKGWYHTC